MTPGPKRYMHECRSEGAREHFFTSVVKTSDCWLWTGMRSVGGGYGRFVWKRKSFLAHRVSYLLHHGAVPRRLTLDHLCRNRLCVNPAHLEPVTIGENVLRGIGIPAMNARKTHCKNGHPFSGANLRIAGKRRVCRTCWREWKRAYEQLPAVKAKRRQREGREQHA